jgi:hypothetical protein
MAYQGVQTLVGKAPTLDGRTRTYHFGKKGIYKYVHYVFCLSN